MILKARSVANVVFLLLCDFPGVLILYADVSGQSACPETSAHNIQTPVNHPKERIPYKLLNQLFELVSFCSKIFYSLKLITLIKILKLITPTCFGPTGPSSGNTSILTKVTTDS